MNKDTAVAQANLNRIDQYTPQGSLVYNQVGTNADGTPHYSQTQTLSPDEQAKYDLSNKVALAMNGLAVNNISRVQDVQSKPFSFDGMTPLRTSVGNGNPFGISAGPRGAYGTQSGIADPGAVRRMSGNEGGPVQGSLDYSKLTALPGTNDFGAEADKMSDAVYKQATSRLDPQFRQQDSDMRSRLAAQGISENSDAYRRELDNFSRSRNDAYGAATFAARQAGAQEQSRLFGLAMGARQQGQNEANTQGQFWNAAQGQRFDQALQTYGQNNQAQDQQYQQALGIADLSNQAEAQRFGQDQSAAAFNNNAQTQWYNQDTANATFGNNARQQQISEASYLRNLPLNEIAALLGTGGGVNNPEFQQFAQVGVASPDYTGLVANNYNAKMNRYNQQQAARSSMLGSIFGTLGSIGGAVAMSDMRVKTDIRRIGTLANGIATYAFKYIGDAAQRFGVMAQEVFKVNPGAVGRVGDLLYVDYAKVYA